MLGAIEVGATIGLTGALDTNGGDPISAVLFGILVLPVLGIVILGLPALVVVVPLTLVWARLVHVAEVVRTA